MENGDLVEISRILTELLFQKKLEQELFRQTCLAPFLRDSSKKDPSLHAQSLEPSIRFEMCQHFCKAFELLS